MPRKCTQAEMDRLFRLGNARDVAVKEFELELAKVRHACEAPGSATILDQDTGDWVTQEEMQRKQAEMAGQRPRLVANTAPTPLPTGKFADKVRRGRRG